ncbi:unnamed protein product [Bursaphelenchus okinawaensis]|uniref:BCAS3 WD40 domain-containing protein n=1 Tax=Bursaphelenchus okinawaensis TaxID=465554 RepID=A0A811KH61_9BILA|nr:unnamed protein product [Bursaphelenchus okinawaensis]CAG9103101.1 unnamed protein product [Bursaphelenchus okinawaensis]
MSMSHGRSKKQQQNGHSKESVKKGQVNTVFPICRPPPKCAKTDVANGNGASVRYTPGQIIRPRAAHQPRIVTSVAEFVSEVIPQGSTQNHNQNEPIQWVRIQKIAFEHNTETFLVVVGLVRGYQIFLMRPSGECEEVLSERRGPLRVAHLLPASEKSEDKFENERPLVGLVDGNPMAADNKFCSVNVISLRTGNSVHILKFDEPVLDLNSTKSCIVVVLSSSIVVFDLNTLQERTTIPVNPNDAPLAPVYAISDSILAFADKNFNLEIQSCGGRCDSDDQSYSGQVMSAAKSLSKTVTSLGESIVSSFSSPGDKKNGVLLRKGIVSVISTAHVPDNDNDHSHYLAHFIAHESRVACLAFGHGGRLLVTGNEIATTFNVFVLHPHPTAPSLSSVQHIYTLHRGSSAAKVIDTAFTSDNRWLAIATNHGTTHVFAISPYGGPVTFRTHGGKFVNKESRFERTAGLTQENQVSYSVHSKTPAPGYLYKDHPHLKHQLLSKTVLNPRLSKYPPPIVLWAQAKIKQKVFSAENFSAWATDNSPVPISSSNWSPHMANGQPLVFESLRRMSLCFGTVYGSRCAAPDVPVLFVMGPDGILSQYKMDVKRERFNSSGSVSSLNADDSNKTVEAPVRVRVVALSEWSLTRSKGTVGVDFICPPLPEGSSLLEITDPNNEKKRGRFRKTTQGSWLPHVEITTYSGPHRRIWMGPQFSFGVYAFTGHSSAELVSPGGKNNSMHLFTTPQKCCPVLIEKNSNNMNGRTEGLENATKILCGSFTDPVMYGDDPLASLKEQLEDAMQDELKSKENRFDSSSPSSSSSK